MIEEYLKQCVELRNNIRKDPPKGYNYICQEEYVLDRGRRFFERSLSKEERLVVERAKKRIYIAESHCFENCLRLVLSDRTGKLRYVEGFAQGVIVVHHAWAVLNDAVVDVTWDSSDHLRSITPDRQYIGVEFDKKRLRKKLKDRQLSFLDDWYNRWPLLKEKKLSSSNG